MKNVATIVAVVVGLFTITGGIWVVDSTYTRAEKTCRIETRLDRKIKMDTARNLRQRMWDLQSHYGEEDAKVLKEYKELRQELEFIMQDLERTK